jgi:hypothetical protein
LDGGGEREKGKAEKKNGDVDRGKGKAEKDSSHCFSF